MSNNFESCKVEKMQDDSQDSIPSPSHSVKTQIMGGKVCLRWTGKTLLGIVNNIFVLKQCFTFTSFPPIIWIFIEDEGDGIESRLTSSIFSTLPEFRAGQTCSYPECRLRQQLSTKSCRLRLNFEAREAEFPLLFHQWVWYRNFHRIWIPAVQDHLEGTPRKKA